MVISGRELQMCFERIDEITDRLLDKLTKGRDIIPPGQLYVVVVLRCPKISHGVDDWLSIGPTTPCKEDVMRASTPNATSWRKP
jgi:hypothetical protein